MKDKVFTQAPSLIDYTIQRIVETKFLNDFPYLESIIAYHFGWQGKSVIPGKKIRPTLLLLTCDALGGDWKHAVRAAAAVELIHNFSLVHDDIQDQGEFRHGKPAVWKKFGMAQAINAGDALLACAYSAVTELSKYYSSEIVNRISAFMSTTCEQLIGGQSLDLQFENQKQVKMHEYFKMITGKTAALFSASAKIGAMLSSENFDIHKQLASFGTAFGVAFQIQDDWLGIWGVNSQTGKPVGGDLSSGKMTLPIIHGISKNETFRRSWQKRDRIPNDAKYYSDLLFQAGAKQITEESAKKWIEQAIAILKPLKRTHPRVVELEEYCIELLGRNK